MPGRLLGQLGGATGAGEGGGVGQERQGWGRRGDWPKEEQSPGLLGHAYPARALGARLAPLPPWG